MSGIRLQSRRIPVTGGAGGLGEAIAHRLAEEGAWVAIVELGAERGTALAREIGGRFYPLDVSGAATWQATIAAINSDAGGLDGLVNNAGIAHSKGDPMKAAS